MKEMAGGVEWSWPGDLLTKFSPKDDLKAEFQCLGNSPGF